MNIDDSALEALVEQSKDIHNDAMRQMSDAVKETVELHHESDLEPDPDGLVGFASERSTSIGAGTFGMGILGGLGFGAALLAVTASAASASTSMDIQILQTAASIEVLAVATYSVALTLPFIGGPSANPVISGFAKTTMAQHSQHLAAFNAAVTQLGAKAQNSPDPVLLSVVNKAKAGLTTPLDVVNLALELEQGAAETYVKDVALLSGSNKSAIATTASIMGVEAQHASILRAVQALLQAGAPQLIQLSPTLVTSLPAVAGSVGFPNSFFPTTAARPVNEGALQ